MSVFKTKRRREFSNVKKKTNINTHLVALLARYYGIIRSRLRVGRKVRRGQNCQS